MLPDYRTERIIAETNAALWNLHEQGVIRMVRDMPAVFEDTERLPWDADFYELRLIGVEEKPNKYYHDKPYVDERTGEQKPADSPQFEKNLCYKFEVVKGDKKGDWLFVNFISKYFRVKNDGELVGKRAKIAHAINPDLDIKANGISEEEDLMHGFVRASLLPKENGKYADVTAWTPTRLSITERAEINGIKLTEVKKDAPASDIGEEDIPF